MATTIKATCDTCGDVKLSAYAVVARVCLDNQEGSYRFTCPVCKKIVVKDASSTIINLLATNGVKKEEWKLPSELWEPHPGGPTITLDDVLAFHEQLESGDYEL